MLCWWYFVLGAVLSVLTVTGNGFVIYLVVRKTQLHNPTNWIALSLATADILIGSGCILIEYLSETLSITHRLRFAIPSFLFAASATNLCLLTFDRFVFITEPLSYVTLMTTKKTRLLIFTVWTISFLPHFTFFLINDILAMLKDHNAERDFMLFDFVFFEILPIVVLSYFTGRIFYIARQKSLQTAQQMKQLRFNHREQNGANITTKNQRNNSLRIIGVAVAVFLVCYLNDVCYTILYQLRGGKNKQGTYRYILNLLYIANSAINPVSYALFKRDMKTAIKGVFNK